MKRSSVVDATLIAATSSTKNQDKRPDPEMSQTKKDNQWYFGVKAHIGIDANSELIHTVECTTAKVADNVMLKDCLHGEEEIFFASRGYHQNRRTIEHFASEYGLAFLISSKNPKGVELTEQQKKFNRVLVAIGAVIKQQFCFTKLLRYRELKKNNGKIVTLFTLTNFWIARHRLIPTTGKVRP